MNDNLYEAPDEGESFDRNPPPSIDADRPRKPNTPLVFGILGCIFGGAAAAFGVIGLVFASAVAAQDPNQDAVREAMGVTKTWEMVSALIGLAINGLETVAAIALLQRSDLGRKLFNVFAGIEVLWGLFGAVYGALLIGQMDLSKLPDEMQQMGPFFQIMAYVSLIFGLLWLLYPVLGLVFLNKPAIRQYLRREPPYDQI